MAWTKRAVAGGYRIIHESDRPTAIPTKAEASVISDNWRNELVTKIDRKLTPDVLVSGPYIEALRDADAFDTISARVKIPLGEFEGIDYQMQYLGNVVEKAIEG